MVTRWAKSALGAEALGAETVVDRTKEWREEEMACLGRQRVLALPSAQQRAAGKGRSEESCRLLE